MPKVFCLVKLAARGHIKKFIFFCLSTRSNRFPRTFHSSGEWRFFQFLKALDLGIILHGQTSLAHLAHLSYCLKRVFWFFGPSGLSCWAILDFSMRLDSSTSVLSGIYALWLSAAKNGVVRSKTKIVRKKTQNCYLSSWAALSSGTHTKVIPTHRRYDHGIWFWSTPFEGWPHGPTLSKIFC